MTALTLGRAAHLPVSTSSEEAMRQSAVNGRRLPATNRAVVADRINALLRRRHPKKTAEHVSAETSIPAGTVAKWLERGSSPGAVGTLLMILAYGPEFLAEVYAEQTPEWVKEAIAIRAASQRTKAKIEPLLIEGLKDENRKLAARMASLEAALGISDPEYHRHTLDALGSIPRGDHRPVERERLHGDDVTVVSVV
jgi:hypothetical protein